MTQSFYYDEINRLYCANDLIKNVTEYYDYDKAGNILDVETYSYDANGYVNSNSLISTDSYGYTDTNWKDKLTSYNNQAITYDEIGNPLSYKGYTLSWQNGRQLATLSGNGVTASYTYDCDGYRTSKTVNGVVHNYYYMGGRLQYEAFGSNKLWFLYDADGSPIGLRYDDGTAVTYYYYVCNWRGDVVALYSDTGLICKYDYDAWGNITAVNDANGDVITSTFHIANINPIRYRG